MHRHGAIHALPGYAPAMRLTIACLTLCALLVAACGGSGSDDAGSTAVTDFAAPAPPVAGTGPSLNSLLGLPDDSTQIDTPILKRMLNRAMARSVEAGRRGAD